VLKLGHKELHSFDGMSAFASLLKHAYKQTALELGDGTLIPYPYPIPNPDLKN